MEKEHTLLVTETRYALFCKMMWKRVSLQFVFSNAVFFGNLIPAEVQHHTLMSFKIQREVVQNSTLSFRRYSRPPTASDSWYQFLSRYYCTCTDSFALAKVCCEWVWKHEKNVYMHLCILSSISAKKQASCICNIFLVDASTAVPVHIHAVFDSSLAEPSRGDVVLWSKWLQPLASLASFNDLMSTTARLPVDLVEPLPDYHLECLTWTPQ